VAGMATPFAELGLRSPETADQILATDRTRGNACSDQLFAKAVCQADLF
jgi:hypothetical protein